jgi:hypothetical protein
MADQNDVVWILDSAPADGGAPLKFMVHRAYAQMLIAEAPDHRSIISVDAPLPKVRSDNQLIDWSVRS